MFGIVLNPECSHLKAEDYIYFAMIKQCGAYVYGLVTKKTGTVVYVVLERYAAIGQEWKKPHKNMSLIKSFAAQAQQQQQWMRDWIWKIEIIGSII